MKAGRRVSFWDRVRDARMQGGGSQSNPKAQALRHVKDFGASIGSSRVFHVQTFSLKETYILGAGELFVRINMILDHGDGVRLSTTSEIQPVSPFAFLPYRTEI